MSRKVSTRPGRSDAVPYTVRAAGPRPITVHLGGRTVVVEGTGEPPIALPWKRDGDGAVLLDVGTAGDDDAAPGRIAAACLVLLDRDSALGCIRLRAAEAPLPAALERALSRSGLAARDADGPAVLPDLLWQQAGLWLPQGAAPFPQRLVWGSGVRHPLRAPKPDGILYGRYIPWLERTLTFRAVDPDADLPIVHRWMNDPRVAAIWEEAGDLAHHRAYLDAKVADPHLMPLIGCFDGVPFGYFELYWAKEDRLGPFYEAHDYDRGWHVLVGEDAYRGKGWITAWLPSLMHFMFLDDSRTQRIVGEPRASHAQQIRNLDRSGFAKIKPIDFPHKRALLVMLLRESFFADRLWMPAPDAPTAVGYDRQEAGAPP